MGGRTDRPRRARHEVIVANVAGRHHSQYIVVDRNDLSVRVRRASVDRIRRDVRGGAKGLPPDRIAGADGERRRSRRGDFGMLPSLVELRFYQLAELNIIVRQVLMPLTTANERLGSGHLTLFRQFCFGSIAPNVTPSRPERLENKGPRVSANRPVIGSVVKVQK